jgi:hypothetical protein
VGGESWLEAAFRCKKFECVKYLYKVGFRVVNVKGRIEKRIADASLDCTLLNRQLTTLANAEKHWTKGKASCSSEADCYVKGLQVVFRPTLCGSTSCRRMQIHLTFVTCGGCKTDDYWEEKI